MLLLVVVMACGAAKIAAQNAVQRAEEQGRRLEETHAPAGKTITYRVHMKNVGRAIEEGQWKKAEKEAGKAETEAQRIIEDREIMAGELKIRIDKITMLLESQPYPRKAIQEGYFDALEAFQNHEYEKAAQVLAEVETLAVREIRLGRNPEVLIHAPPEYFRKYGPIPMYEDISEDGVPGKVKASLKKSVRARFLGARYIKRDVRFVRVRVTVDNKNYEGWVEGRFVE